MGKPTLKFIVDNIHTIMENVSPTDDMEIEIQVGQVPVDSQIKFGGLYKVVFHGNEGTIVTISGNDRYYLDSDTVVVWCVQVQDFFKWLPNNVVVLSIK
ncbi:MAG: hypothetical protein ACR2MS_07855 [Weeksellaceae bacterium]